MAGGDWAGRRERGGENQELAGARTVGENEREGLDGKPGRGVEEVREIGATGRMCGGAGAGGGAGEWPEMEAEVERMAVRRSGGGGGGGGGLRRRRLEDGGVAKMGRRTVAGARSGGGRRGGGGGWTPSPAFLEQPLEREITPFFVQMTARICGGVPSPLIEPIMGRDGKGPT